MKDPQICGSGFSLKIQFLDSLFTVQIWAEMEKTSQSLALGPFSGDANLVKQANQTGPVALDPHNDLRVAIKSSGSLAILRLSEELGVKYVWYLQSS